MATDETVPAKAENRAASGATGAVSGATPASASARGARIFYMLAIAVLLGVVAYFGRGIVIPVIVAGFASFLIYTLKQAIRAAPVVGRYLPNAVCFAFAFLAIVFVTVLFVEIIAENVEALIKAWPKYEARLRGLTVEGLRFLEQSGYLPEDLLGGVDEFRRTALEAVNPILRELAASVRQLTANSVTIFLYTVFMLLERGRLFRKVNLLNDDEDKRAAVNDTIAEIGVMVRQYITVKTASNLVTATASYIIMSLIGVDFAGFWALLIFVLNYIPIVGAVSAITLPVLLSLVQPEGGGLKTAALTLTALVAAEQTMSSVIEPRLIGRSLNLSPLVVLLSLAVWGALWGFAGALLAVPMTVTTMIILSQFEETRPIAILLSDSGRIDPIRRGARRSPG